MTKSGHNRSYCDTSLITLTPLRQEWLSSPIWCFLSSMHNRTPREQSASSETPQRNALGALAVAAGRPTRGGGVGFGNVDDWVHLINLADIMLRDEHPNRAE